jgi:hypothetical protein
LRSIPVAQGPIWRPPEELIKLKLKAFDQYCLFWQW